MHDWRVERTHPRRRSRVALPANFRRTCQRCGAVEVRSGNVLGDPWRPLTRHDPQQCTPKLDAAQAGIGTLLAE